VQLSRLLERFLVLACVAADAFFGFVCAGHKLRWGAEQSESELHDLRAGGAAGHVLPSIAPSPHGV